MDLEKRIEIVQRSTRTSVPYFVPMHNALRMHYSWYYRWHLNRFSSLVHLFLVAIISLAAIFFVYRGWTTSTTATPSPGSITITSAEDFNNNSSSSNLTVDPTGYVAVTDLNSFTTVSNSFSHSTCSEAFPPGNIADGNGSSWDSLCLEGDWIEWNFGGVTDFSRVRISGSEVDTDPISVPEYSFQYWDGAAWVTSFTEYGAGEGFFTDRMLSVSTDRIRIIHAGMPILVADEVIQIFEVELYNGATGTIISGDTQLDGGAGFGDWTTFSSTVDLPADTSLAYRFRTSEDALTWSSWTAATPYAASIDLATLLGDTDKIKRYLQVESTLANTDGTSNPVLHEYTANYMTATCPAGSTQTDGSVSIDSQEELELGSVSPSMIVSDGSLSLAPSELLWSAETAMPESKANHGTAYYDGEIFIIGGSQSNSVFAYNPATDTYSAKANLPGTCRGVSVPTYNETRATTFGDKIYVVAGTYQCTLEYDPATDEWSELTGMPYTGVEDGFDIVSGDEYIYVLGGNDPDMVYNLVSRYNPSTDTWDTAATLPVARSFLRAVRVGGYIYALSGDGAPYRTFERYNISTNSWETLANLPIDAGGTASGVAELNGKIYVAGGLISGTSHANFYEYDIDMGTWSAKSDLVSAVAHHSVVSDGTRIYSFGASLAGSDLAQSWPNLENSSATHISASTQLDGTAGLTSWDTFAPTGTTPSNTSISFRFRTSDDGTTWGVWSSAAAFAASIDLTALLGETDIAYRYLQVETTLAHTDEAVSPTLDSYTADYIICVLGAPDPTCDDGIQNGDETGVDCGGSCIACAGDGMCPEGSTATAEDFLLTDQGQWELGTLVNTDATSGNLTLDSEASSAINLVSIGTSTPEAITASNDIENKLNPIDGFEAPSYWGGYRFSTSFGLQEWWQIDLGQTYQIDQVNIYAEALSGQFKIQTSNDGVSFSDQTDFFDPLLPSVAWIENNVIDQARYVRIVTNLIEGLDPDPYVMLADVAISTAGSGTHTSASTQIDGGENFNAWTTFSPTATIPANTSVSFRFRTSPDGTNWSGWSVSTPYAASIDISGLDNYRYLQVETTLANTDGASTPQLDSYTVNYTYCQTDPVPTCDDGIQNGDETGVDCGGSCEACPVPPACDDGIQNGDETGIDCGGSCEACPVIPTCDDGVQNGDETGIDCGGSCEACPIPPACDDGIQNGDETGVDCGGSCDACPTCDDGVQNGDETGIDCGGSCDACPTCDDGIQNGYETGVDCGGVCEACPIPPACDDGIQNGDETGVDCGGSCPACPVPPIDPSCYDGIQNQDETGVDCGGVCPPCSSPVPDSDPDCSLPYLVQPNGGERYHVNDSIPVRWYYTSADRANRVTEDDMPVIMSISIDGGVNYQQIKALIPADDPSNSYVTQFRAEHPELAIGTYQSIENNVLEYYWIPGSFSYVSKTVRLKIEPIFHDCISSSDSDASDNNFEIFISDNPVVVRQSIVLEIYPPSHKVKPGEEAAYTIKAFLKDGTEVTGSTTFTYIVSDAASLKSSAGNLVNLIAGEMEGYYDKAVLATGVYNGQTTTIYGALEIIRDILAQEDDSPPPPDCDFWCSIDDFIEEVADEVMGTGSIGDLALATLLAALIALGNMASNLLSVFNNLIAPFIKGREKKKGIATVYDVVTGLPIPKAKVLLISGQAEKMEAVSVTNKNGQYRFEVSPGKEYQVRVEKDGYSQYKQSSKMEDKGLLYDNNYFGQRFTTGPEEYAINFNIPMNESEPGVMASATLKYSRIRGILVALNLSLIFFGSGISLVIFLSYPTTINYIVLSLYVLVLAYHLLYRYLICGRSYGEVVNIASTRPVDLAVIRVVEKESGRLATTLLSDIKGRYSMLLPKGKYHIFASKSGLKQRGKIELEVKKTFVPQHETILMDRETEENRKPHETKGRPRQFNDSAEIIDYYRRKPGEDPS